MKKLLAPAAIALGSLLLALPAGAAIAPGGTTAQASDYESSPPQVVQGSDPFLLINLSVELTQQAEAFTDGQQTYANGTYCPGRVSGRGVCYTGAETFIGYFDSEKCYVYRTNADTINTQSPEGPYGPNHPSISTFNASYFAPVGATNSNHECNVGARAATNGNEFSGNFMNWASMTALDQFRSAMTGGARFYDTAGAFAMTMLVRTYRYDDWPFVDKAISSGGITTGSVTFTTDPGKVTPFSSASGLFIRNNWGTSGHRVRFYDQSWNNIGTLYNVIVEVCNPYIGLESNCVPYTNGVVTWYKPEGLLQKNALKMRYALTSYTGRTGNGINGGVLRSNAKYIGEFAPTTSGGYQTNTVAETDANGLVAFNPDGVTLGSGVVNSGIINYINQFALYAGNYKSNDPAAELYYEGLRYIMGLDPTPSFSPGSLTNAERDGYPIYDNSTAALSWIDPITSANSCQANYALYVGDQFAHQDNYLPGESCGSECTDFVYDDPTSTAIPPPQIQVNADTWTDTVGQLEGLGSTLGNTTRGRGDGYWIAGLAYWANISDVRPDRTGKQSVKTFMVDTQEYNSSPPMRQNNQLWLAAKYGGFDDYDGDDRPNLNGLSSNANVANPEWTSDTGANPDPDAYTLASQPLNLVAGLTNVFNNVLQSSSSASAAAVVSNSAQGVGALYEAIYEPRLSNSGVVTNWSGMVRGLFLDAQGEVREDTVSDGVLTSSDLVVRYIKNNSTGTVTADLLDPTTLATVQSGVQVRDLKGIWNARDQLSSMSNSAVVSNRNYLTEDASVGRYIMTWVDLDQDGILDDAPGTNAGDEFIAFDETTMSSFDTSSSTLDTARFLGLQSSSAGSTALVQQLAMDIVNYIRGVDKAGWRNRTIDLGDGLGSRTLRLGDVVHSAPLVVGPPSSGYDRTYADDSYLAFKQQYAKRRQVVYVGANDGMLHAFNGGFFQPASKSFTLTSTPTSGELAHPLGSELWGYVPYNLLPHLQWLKDTNYPHVYYVDGSPQAFDVNIWPSSPSDTVHVNGWGTILVVGFRLGGGDITIDPDSDTDAVTGDDVTLRSAYAIFDITDPESEPQLLAEVTDPALGFTTSQPTVVKKRVPNSGSFIGATDQWYLVFGSGPAGTGGTSKRTALLNATSNQNAKIYLLDLTTTPMQLVSGSPFDTGQANGFVGDIVYKDWNQNYDDEVAYFGTVATTTTTSGSPPVTTTVPDGSLYRMDLSGVYSGGSPSFVDMFNGSANQPFSAPPYPTRDVAGKPWVYAGSGRFFVDSDITLSAQMSYYGIKETASAGSVNTTAQVNKSSLEDTTGVQVFTDGTVNPAGSISASTWTGLLTEVGAAPGWYMDFSSTYARHVDRTVQILGSIFFTDYVTTGDACQPLGSSNLYALNMLTGTASPFAAFGTDPANPTLATVSVYQGVGQSFISGVIQDSSGNYQLRTSTSLSENTGQGVNLPGTVGARMSWRELPLK